MRLQSDWLKVNVYKRNLLLRNCKTMLQNILEYFMGGSGEKSTLSINSQSFTKRLFYPPQFNIDTHHWTNWTLIMHLLIKNQQKFNNKESQIKGNTRLTALKRNFFRKTHSLRASLSSPLLFGYYCKLTSGDGEGKKHSFINCSPRHDSLLGETSVEISWIAGPFVIQRKDLPDYSNL